MSTNNNTTTDEINALYKQNEEAMTADQVKTTKDMKLSQEDLQAIMQTYGLQMPQGAPGNQAGGTTRGTLAAGPSGGSAVGGFTGGGPGGGFGGPPPDMPGTAPGSNQTTRQSTPQPGSARQSIRGGMNLILVDPLIKLLEERAVS